MPFDFFGDDEQAATQRRLLTPDARRGWVFEQPSPNLVTAAGSRLQRIDNPVGLMLLSTLRPMESVSRFAFEHWQDLGAARHVIRKRLRQRPTTSR